MRRLLSILLIATVSAGFAGDGRVVGARADGRPVTGTNYLASAAPDDPTVQVLAEVDGTAITAEAFKEHYIEYLLRTGTEDGARMRRALLAQMVNDRLLIADAVADGIEATSAYKEHLATARDKLAIELYFERHVLGDLEVTDADVEEAFVRINTTLTARHLFARTKAEADDLYARLVEGAGFDDLARATFGDPELANNGGAIGSFTFDETDPAFEDAAYGLAVGEISKPVRTAQGYSIIQLTDRFTQPILTELAFAKRKDELGRLVLRRKRGEARKQFLRALADEAMIVVREPAFSRLLGQITGTVMIQSLEAFLEEPLVAFDGGGWSVDDFRRRAQNTDSRRRAAVRTEADLKEFITGLIVREELLRRAERLRLEAEYESAVTRVMDDWILTSKKSELAGSVEIPDADVKAHYAAHAAEYRDEDGRPLSFEDAEPRIREALLFSRTQESVLEYIAELRREHEVAVNDDLLLSLPIAGRPVRPIDRNESTVF